MHFSLCARQRIPRRSPAVKTPTTSAKPTAAKHPAPPGLQAARSAACMRTQPHKIPHARAYARTHPQTTTPAAGAAGGHDRAARLEMLKAREPAASRAMAAQVLTAEHGAGTDRIKPWVPDAARAPQLPGVDLRTHATASHLKLLAGRRVAGPRRRVARRARPRRRAPCAAERAELAHRLARVDAARPDAPRRGAAAGCRLTVGATPGCRHRRSAGRRPGCTGPTGRPRRAWARTPRPPGRAGTARG